MAVMSDTGGAILQYVTRQVEGYQADTRVKFDAKTLKNVRVADENADDKVIVFFPNKAVQVMTAKEADAKGFLRQPEIIGFDQVSDPRSPAGRYKFAMTHSARKEAWMQMEQHLIALCISKHGMPLPREASFKETSLWTDEE